MSLSLLQKSAAVLLRQIPYLLGKFMWWQLMLSRLSSPPPRQTWCFKVKLAVIKDYESAFDAVTLIQIPEMISLSDFQPLSIAQWNQNFFINKGGFTERYFSVVHAILIEEVTVQTMLRDSAHFRRLTSWIGLKYQHSNFSISISY